MHFGRRQSTTAQQQTQRQSSSSHNGHQMDMSDGIVRQSSWFPSTRFIINIRLIKLTSCLLLYLFVIQSVQARIENKQPTACGTLTQNSDDPRAETPWNAGVFLRPQNASSSEIKFFTHGFLLTSTMIGVLIPSRDITYFPVIDTKYPMQIPGPQQIIVGIAFQSKPSLRNDRFTQFRQVIHVEPYATPTPSKKPLFHLIVLHLKSPFDLSSSLAGTLCVPAVPDTKQQFQFVRHVFKEYHDALYTGRGTPLLADPSGNTRSPFVLFSENDQCAAKFKSTYHRDIEEGVFCVRVVNNALSTTGSSCLRQGHPLTVTMFGRSFLLGSIVLTPSTTSDICANPDPNLLYFAYAPSLDQVKWLRHKMNCQSSFACSIPEKGSTSPSFLTHSCIPFSRACDGKGDCPNSEDENALICKSWNETVPKIDVEDHKQTHHSPVSFISLSLNATVKDPGKPKATGDHNNPREFRAIASPANKNANSVIKQESSGNFPKPVPVSNASVIDVKKSCSPLPRMHGVEVICRHQQTKRPIDCSPSKTSNDLSSAVPIHTVVAVTCKRLHSSSFNYSSLQMTCLSTGTWAGVKPFKCVPDCSMTNDAHSQSSSRAPWHAALFRVNNNIVYYQCGATLISQDFLLTAAHCIHDNDGYSAPTAYSHFKIVLNPSSANFTAIQFQSRRQDIHDVKRIWYPSAYDRSTLRSDIALVQLKRPAKLNGQVRPACFASDIDTEENKVVDVQEKATVAGFGISDRSNLLTPLKYADFVPIPKTECELFVGRIPSGSLCGVRSQGAALCKGDSGGGLVVKEQLSNGHVRFVIKGIVSHRAQATQSCDLYGPVVFTFVDAFKSWAVNQISTAR